MTIRKKAESIKIFAVVGASALMLSISSVQASLEGQALYMQHCSMCHQPDGKGITGFFPPLADNERANSDDPKLIQDYLRRIIFGYHGGLIVNNQMYTGRMPPIGYVGRLTDSELLKLINYQRTSWGSDAREITLDELTRAREAGSLK